MRIVSWFPSTPEMAQGGHSRRLSRDRPRQKDRRLTDPTDYVATLSAQAGDQTGLANDSAVFLMVPDNQFAKLLAVAKIEIKSKCGHAPLKVGKLGGLTNGLADASDDFRRHLGRRGDAKPVLGVKSRHSAFSDRRHLRQHPVALLR